MGGFLGKIASSFIDIVPPAGGEHRRRVLQYLLYSGRIQVRFLIRLSCKEIKYLVQQRGIWFLVKSFYKAIISSFTNIMPVIGVRHRRKAVESLVYSESTQFLIKLLCSNADEEKGLTTRLLTEDFRTPADIIQELAQLQKEKIKRTLDSSKKTIATYSPTGAYREQLGNIVDRLRDKGYNALTFVGIVDSEEYKKEENIFYASPDIIGFMDFVDVFICTTGPYPLLPTNAKIIEFMHDVHDSPPGDLDNILDNILFFDYFFLPSSRVVDRVKQQIYAARDKLSKHMVAVRQACLIPGGYIKLDRNMGYFEKNKRDSKAIIYAPTVIGPGFEDIVSLEAYSDKIIGAVLDNFPDYELIFRPHPHTVSTPYVQHVLRKYKRNPRFSFDDNATFYMDNYSRSALMITDMSGTAYTYALTTSRPVIFFSHNERKVMKRLIDYRYFSDRGKVGYVAENIDEMVEKIKLLLANKDEFSLQIKQYRDSLVYNVGKAEDYFVANFGYIIEDKKHPDWIYL